MSSTDQASKKDFKKCINDFLESFQKKAIADPDLWADYGEKLYYKFNQQDIKRALSRIRERHTKIDANPLPLILETLESLGAKEQKLIALPTQTSLTEPDLLNALSRMIVKYVQQGFIDNIFLARCADKKYRIDNAAKFKEEITRYINQPSLLKMAGDELGITVPYSIFILNKPMSAYSLAKHINEMQKINAK
tara:strand:- start:1570 stop:2148 length:579 start_codon:yes stop_codon:yes gene_type:complete